MKQTIKGVLAMDGEKVRFLEDWHEGMFKDGVYSSSYSQYIFIKEQEFEYELPADFDPIKPQISALDAKEKELTFQYNQALNHIKAKRQELLAIGND